MYMYVLYHTNLSQQPSLSHSIHCLIWLEFRDSNLLQHFPTIIKSTMIPGLYMYTTH